MSAHVQLFIHQHPQVLLSRAALSPFIHQPVLVAGVAPTDVQEPALGLVEPHEVHTGSLVELVQVPLDGIMSLRYVDPWNGNREEKNLILMLLESKVLSGI